MTPKSTKWYYIINELFFIFEENFDLRETTPFTGIPRVKISEYPTLKAETANNFLHEPYNTLSEFKASSERRPS